MAVPSSPRGALKEMENAFSFSSSDLHQMVLDFHAEMQRGLRGETSSLKMLPSFIDCPSGKEKGHFIGLDLGGTNFRVLQVHLNGKEAVVEQASKYVIPHAATQGRGVELFDFIAQSIEHFLSQHTNGQKKKIPLGFTFSFPVDQTAIDKGRLVSWTKAFSASDVVNKDVVRLLVEALHRNNVQNVDVLALINDTVGTLLAKSYTMPDSDVGVIFGTGTNGCYRESTVAISRMSRFFKMSDTMIVNTEWGNFNLLPGNGYDRKLDKQSSNPGKQQMEKMISGMYLGELARLAIKDLVQRKIILREHTGKFRKGSLGTIDIASFEADRTPGFHTIETYLAKKGINDSSLEERRYICQVCRHVSRRAARISAAAISSLVTWIDPSLERDHTICIDGTLYDKYPQFKYTILKTLTELHGKSSSKIKLIHSKDSSGVGAAIASAIISSSN